MSESLPSLLERVRACRICAEVLPHEPRPVVQAGAGARVAVIGQAPGRAVHETGIPWNDPSGRRLRAWLELDEAKFYDADRIALVPMGFCFPGSGRSGDRPPRPECAPTWHPPLWEAMEEVRLRILVGRHAVGRYLPEVTGSLADAVRAAAEVPEGGTVVLPHPSPRNQRWPKAHPWFERDVLPWVRRRVAQALAE